MKKVAVIIMSIIVMLLLTGCANEQVAQRSETKEPMAKKLMEDMKSNAVFDRNYLNDGLNIIVDQETGVNYIVARESYLYKSLSVAIVPRLKANGELYVSPINKGGSK